VGKVVDVLATTPGRRNADSMGFVMVYSRLYMPGTGDITLQMVSFVKTLVYKFSFFLHIKSPKEKNVDLNVVERPV
jgi:hypothetical protein